ncbi:GIY-YIG nuclease family protein [Pirellulales bacterium]|nr:GIY-YIG nuclease family protein [Pirellulales bacterium]
MDLTATVKIFLIQGDFGSVKAAEISNWTGKALSGPRSQLDDVLQRAEASKPGVYFLTGVNPETGKDRVYIGEAEVIRSRIKSHLEKDFWKTVTFFVSKDENLTKAHIKYLEGRLIDGVKQAGRYELENSVSSGSHLPESDAADMNVFYERMSQLLPVLGHGFLKSFAKLTTLVPDDLLYCEVKNVKATGRRTENGFLVFASSEAVLEERPSTDKFPFARTLRNQLFTEDVLERHNDRLVFKTDYEFSSPSAAAAVVQGGQANGLREWKDAAGIALKEKEEMELANSTATLPNAPQ